MSEFTDGDGLAKGFALFAEMNARFAEAQKAHGANGPKLTITEKVLLILALLQPEPVHYTVMARALGCEPTSVSSSLTTWKNFGLAKQCGGGLWAFNPGATLQ